MSTLFRFTLCILCTLLFSQAATAKSNEQPLDGIAATVNDTAIAQSEVDTALNALKAQILATNAPMPSAAELHKQALDHVVDRKLELQVAEQAGIKITDKQLDETVNNIAKQNNITAEQLYQKVAAENLTRTGYRNEIRDELMLQQIQQQQVGSKITMVPEDVKNFMRSKEWQTTTNGNAATASVTEYQIQDVIVLITENMSGQDLAATKAKAEQLAAQAKQGTDLSHLIATNDKTIERNDLGWRQLNEIPSAFTDKISQAKKGSIIGPIQAGNGFHIIQLTDLRTQKSAAPVNAQPVPTEADAKQMVYQRKFAEALKKWIARLRSQAVINLHPGAVV